MGSVIGDITSRRTIEALRAGVPNRDAVAQLGCNHPEIESGFLDLLQRGEAGLAEGVQPRGILVSGEFGSGKSHLLQYLEHVALQERFVCSKIVISKETSLADPVRVFRAAVSEVRVPEKLGSGLMNVAMALKFNKPAYAAFFEWAGSAAAGLTPHLAASLYLFEYGHDEELRGEIIRFWSGDPLSNTKLKNSLNQLGQLSSYNIGRLPNQAEMARQRFRFATRLAHAAGYRGWVLLVDEVELVGQYGQKQRARAYAELARLLGFVDESLESRIPGLSTVAAITADFEASVLSGGKNDREDIPNKLRATGRDDDALLATLSERGMRVILSERKSLAALTPTGVERTHNDLRRIYSDAFHWDAPEVIDRSRPVLGSAVMRPLVRRWITQWDLLRLFPDERPDIEDVPLTSSSYDENPDLEEAAPRE